MEKHQISLLGTEGGVRGRLQKDTRNILGVMKHFYILIVVVVTSPHGFIRLPELSTEKGEFYLCKLDLNFLIQNTQKQIH